MIEIEETGGSLRIRGAGIEAQVAPAAAQVAGPAAGQAVAPAPAAPESVDEYF